MPHHLPGADENGVVTIHAFRIRHGNIYQPNRLLFASAVRTCYPGDTVDLFGAKSLAGAFCQSGRNFTADRAMFVYQLRRNIN